MEATKAYRQGYVWGRSGYVNRATPFYDFDSAAKEFQGKPREEDFHAGFDAGWADAEARDNPCPGEAYHS